MPRFPEPCMCGADDCRRCYPGRRRGPEDDEDPDAWKEARDRQDEADEDRAADMAYDKMHGCEYD